MAGFGKKQIAPVSQEQLFTQTTNLFSGKLNALNKRRDNALSAFRQAAVDLEDVNKGISSQLEQADKIIEFFQAQKASAQQEMADNAAVRDKIMEIITPAAPSQDAE